ncbi:MAG: hypothetical protein NNA18_11715, partial [Nitrospira sp.]|nr:hypothetical protein [Nitrospira sp.]
THPGVTVRAYNGELERGFLSSFNEHDSERRKKSVEGAGGKFNGTRNEFLRAGNADMGKRSRAAGMIAMKWRR